MTGVKPRRTHKNKMFLIENALEIMYLCLGFGFVVLVFFVVRPLMRVHRLLKKVDGLADLSIEYIQKPLQLLMQVHRVVSPFLRKKK